ncbi:hypothetical protein AHAS_Ahas12G0196400 [Arachis hypogaea]
MNKIHFYYFSKVFFLKLPKCSLSLISEASHFKLSIQNNKKFFLVEVSRIIIELATVKILLPLTKKGHKSSSFPLVIGVCC